MYKLVNKKGRDVLMKNGTPFIYTTKHTAELGKKILEKRRKERLTITDL
jgi:hypothetical protein